MATVKGTRTFEVGGLEVEVDYTEKDGWSARTSDVDGGDPAEQGEIEIESVQVRDLDRTVEWTDISELLEALGAFPAFYKLFFEELDR